MYKKTKHYIGKLDTPPTSLEEVKMVDFETVEFKNIPFGKNNFIEVARKRAVMGNGGQTEFISISRGYFQSDDTKRYKNSVTIPVDEDVRKQIAQFVLEI
ncbi:MAG: hypothetical protein ACMUIE_11145 [Thermoplasmatota archaeon]